MADCGLFCAHRGTCGGGEGSAGHEDVPTSTVIFHRTTHVNFLPIRARRSFRSSRHPDALPLLDSRSVRRKIRARLALLLYWLAPC